MDEKKYSSEVVDEVLDAQVFLPERKKSFFSMYQYATAWDILWLTLGGFLAVVQGVALPMFTLVVGAVTNNFNSLLVDDAAAKHFESEVNHNALYFVYIGVAIIGSASLSSAIFSNRGEVLTARYRKAYLAAVMRQNIAFFDKLGTGEVTTRISNDTTCIQEAIGQKVGTIISGISTFITSLVIAFCVQWKLSCILLSGVFFIISTAFVGSTFLIKFVQMGAKIYAEGSSVAEEALSAIRTTVAFGIQEPLAQRFDGYLKASMGYGLKRGIAWAALMGLIWGATFFIYALSFWEGSRILVQGDTSIGHVFVVITCMLIGAFQFSHVAPELPFLIQGISGASGLKQTIDREPPIDSDSPDGFRPEKIDGHIVLKNISFKYPSRPDVLVLPDFSLDIPAGKTTALVGASGSGKSTIVGLLERFYLPLSGSIYIDGVELEKLNLKWLRQQIGLVSQEPTLFAVTIYENIRYGLMGTEYECVSEEKQREMIIQACKEANAWDFIQSLSHGLDTNVGDRGFLLSGGQKQRIAIARAIVSNPRVLLLDEATSALDTKSEGIVQEALDRATTGRTTIVIAHRLSTIKNADNIVLMSKGVIMEQGTHQELMAKRGGYYQLVEAQTIHQTQNDDTDEQPVPLAHDDEKVPLNDAISRTESSFSGVQSRTVHPPKIGIGKILKTLWDLNRGEQKWIVTGAIFAVLLGYGYPALAILVGHIIRAMMVPASQYHTLRSDVNLYSGMLFMCGCEQIVAGICMIAALTYASECLIRKVRLEMLKRFLRMDLSYYDVSEHTPGTLTGILAADGKAIEGLGGANFGQILQSFVILVGGIIQGIAFTWRIGLVGLSLVPIMLGCGYMRLIVLSRMNERSRKAYEESGSLAGSFVSAIRTVQTLTLETFFSQRYGREIDSQVASSSVPLLISSGLYGISQGLTPWVIALIFWYGSRQLLSGHVGVLQFYIVYIGTVLGSQTAGAVFSRSPDISKARQAASRVCEILNTYPEIDYCDTSGHSLDPEKVRGSIEFQDVYFRYPTRPEVPVLRGLSFSAKRGEFVALVGSSGCGKSTTIGLIEHFYNVDKGAVTIDGMNIMDINVSDLRRCISLVQQEPLLYSGTIRENILFGWKTNEWSEVTDSMVESCCRKANIHDFIMSLPNGYETDVGTHGTLLSGGQKQRIAIARALLRDPAILLLDEATSALDSETEKIVQAALDEAAKGRTTIAIAHRLSTIQRADRIFVFDKGRVVETGTHDELVKLNGIYTELVRLQDLES